MSNDQQNVDKIVNVWYNKCIKRGIKDKSVEDAYHDCMEFGKFVSSVFTNEDDRLRAFDTFNQLIHEEVKDE